MEGMIPSPKRAKVQGKSRGREVKAQREVESRSLFLSEVFANDAPNFRLEN